MYVIILEMYTMYILISFQMPLPSHYVPCANTPSRDGNKVNIEASSFFPRVDTLYLHSYPVETNHHQ